VFDNVNTVRSLPCRFSN